MLTASVCLLAPTAWAKAPPARPPAPSEAPLPADPHAAAEVLALQAKALFAAKKFPEAAKRFMEAYAKEAQPPLVFNAARAYEEAGMTGEAAGLFRLYLSIASDEVGIAKAKERLAALRAQDPNVGNDGDGSTSASPKAQAHLTTSRTQPAPEPAWPRWAVTAVSVAGVAAGAALMLSGSADSKDAAKMTVANDADIKAYNTRFDAAERTWTAGAAVGALGVGIGVWAAWLHLRAPADAERSAWQFGVGARSVVVGLQF